MSFGSVLASTFVLVLVGCSSEAGKSPSDADLGIPVDAAITTTTSLTIDEVISACIRSSACGIKTYPTLASCVDAFYSLYLPRGLGPAYDKIYGCVNKSAGDCTAIATCHRQGAACDNTYQATCAGDVASSCDLIDKKVYVIDCATANMICRIGTGQTITASCTLNMCTTATSSCQGNLLLTCSGGIIEVTDCSGTGLVCGYGGGKTKSYACQGELAETCTLVGKIVFATRCEGSTAVTCVHERVHREDCTKYKLRKTACSGGACVVAGTECSSTVNRCAGDRLEVCLDGTWKQYDCVALGLGVCKTASTYGANCSDPSS